MSQNKKPNTEVGLDDSATSMSPQDTDKSRKDPRGPEEDLNESMAMDDGSGGQWQRVFLKAKGKTGNVGNAGSAAMEVPRRRLKLDDLEKIVVIDGADPSRFFGRNPIPVMKTLASHNEQLVCTGIYFLRMGGIKLVLKSVDMVKEILEDQQLQKSFGPRAMAHVPKAAGGASGGQATRTDIKVDGDTVTELRKVIVDDFPVSLDLGELQTVLSSRGVVKVTALRGRSHSHRPMLLEFDDVDKARSALEGGILLYCRLFRTRPVKSFIGPPRCTRCQGIGHSINQCAGEVVCSDCGQKGHQANAEQCSRRAKEVEKLCVNCGGAHWAGYRGCQKFKDARAQLYSEVAKRKSEMKKQVDPSQGQQATGNSVVNSGCDSTVEQLRRVNDELVHRVASIRDEMTNLVALMITCITEFYPAPTTHPHHRAASDGKQQAAGPAVVKAKLLQRIEQLDSKMFDVNGVKKVLGMTISKND